jgi:predicted nucleic acid-binding protein
VVADAGPLIHLDELNSLDVLSDLGEIWIVPTVREELRKHRPSVFDSRLNLSLLYAAPQSNAVDELVPIYALHQGEREALAYCMQHLPALMLTDDTAARLAAKTLRIPAHGTVGLLVRAVRRKLRSPQQVVTLLEAIPMQSTLHLRPALLAEVIDEVRKLWRLS